MPDRTVWTDELHEFCDWLADLQYAAGFAAGYGYANDELAAELRRALGGPHARTYREAAGRHIRAVDAKGRRAAADRGELRTRPDHPGGPVDFDTGSPLWRLAAR